MWASESEKQNNLPVDQEGYWIWKSFTEMLHWENQKVTFLFRKVLENILSN